ncbi:MAG: hypothetical protein ABI670_18195 [Chloroflexota bacterium]
MSRKSTKGSSLRRTQAQNGQQAVTVDSGAVSPQLSARAEEANPRKRSSLLFWLAGGIVAILLVYVALMALAPGLVPPWLRFNPPPAPAPSAAIGTSRISYVRSTPDGKRDLFIINADGTNPQQATSDLQIEGTLAWSPDGQKIILQSTVGGFSRIIRLTVGSDNRQMEAVQLTADINAESVVPVWSPDGKMIAFQSKRDGGMFQVFVMDADGNNKRRLSDGKGYAAWPTWSPDGKSIAYVQGELGEAGSKRELMVVPVAGGGAQQLTHLDTSVTQPIWSPDGATITCRQTMGQYDIRLLIMKPDGSDQRTLVQNVASSGHQYSPDGKKLLYYAVSTQEGENIYTVNVADGKITNLTNSAGANYLPTWSPDGKQIAWSSKTSATEKYKIVVADADGKNIRLLAEGDNDLYQPAWAVVK